MAVDIERPRYFQRQVLGALDFEAEQEYHRDLRRRHNVGHHTWGIVVGLELEERAPVQGATGPIEVFVRPGMAVDGFGREILVLEPFQIAPDPQVFHGLTRDEDVAVWIAYDEERTRRPPAGWEQCEDGENQLTRVREQFRILVGRQDDLRSPIIVAGQSFYDQAASSTAGALTIPPDESVPYQELVDDDPLPRWLVRLGSVHWDGRAGQRRFAGTDAVHLAEERRYVGIVAAELFAPGGRLRVRDRAAQPPAAADETDDLAAVEGSLRVDGLLTARDSVRLEAGMIDLRDADGGAAPNLELYRQEGEGVRIRIGDESNGARSLSVGIDTGTPAAPAWESKLSVNDRGEVNAAGRVDVSGHLLLNERIEIRDAAGGIDTDILWIERVQQSPNHNDLRIVIGDDQFGDDRLTVGPIAFADGQFKEKFAVVNDGTMRAAGNAVIGGGALVGAGGDAVVKTRHVAGKGSGNDNDDDLFLNWATGRNVHIGGGTTGSAPRSGLLVAGNAVVGAGQNGVLKTRHIDGKDWQSDADDNLHLNWGTGRQVVIGNPTQPASLAVTGDILFGSNAAKVPVDVVSGEVHLNIHGTGPPSVRTGTVQLDVASRLARVSDAQIALGLSSIGNVSTAVNARWEIRPGTQTRLDDHTFRFVVNWRVDDTDGFFDYFSWIVIFTP